MIFPRQLGVLFPAVHVIVFWGIWKEAMVRISILCAVCAIVALGTVGLGNSTNTVTPRINLPTWAVYYDSLTAQSSSALATARSTDLDPTDINTSFSASLCINSCLWVQDESYPDSWFGHWFCEYGPALTVCERAKNRYNLRLVTYQSFADKVACHEAGHAAGLWHRASGSNSCMVQGEFPALQSYDAHDKGHINASY